MGKDNTNLAQRMKAYEINGVSQRHLKLCPLIARMDGRSFHTFTKGLGRPYDERLTDLMIETTKHLVDHSGAVLGYTQSDEITLVFTVPDHESEIFFEGKHDKIVSVLASVTSVFFNRKLPEFLPEKSDKMPVFDARAFTVPTLGEAANCLVWREQDATRNSVAMAAQAHYSHNQLHGKNRSTMMEMLHAKGINWNDFNSKFKRGSYVKATRVERPYTAEELAKVPEKHRWKMATEIVSRRVVDVVNMPPWREIDDRVQAYFGEQA